MFLTKEYSPHYSELIEYNNYLVKTELLSIGIALKY